MFVKNIQFIQCQNSVFFKMIWTVTRKKRFPQKPTLRQTPSLQVRIVYFSRYPGHFEKKKRFPQKPILKQTPSLQCKPVFPDNFNVVVIRGTWDSLEPKYNGQNRYTHYGRPRSARSPVNIDAARDPVAGFGL